MRIRIKTCVKGNYLDVFKRFDLDLFTYLLPKFPKIQIVEFTGSRIGDKVHLKVVSPRTMEWVSLITDHGQNEDMAYFVDEGHLLPGILSTWTHKHIVEKKSDSESVIIDDIQFTSTNTILSVLIYPIVFMGFIVRKNLYKKYFKRNLQE